MFRHTPLASKSAYQIVLGLSLCTVASVMLYTYFRHNEEEEDELEQCAKDRARFLKSASKGQQKSITKKLLLQNEQVPLIVGRNGANLTRIEEKTAVRIEFRDKNDTHKFCYITGTQAAVEVAASMMQTELERAVNYTEMMLVPVSICGKITGQCGEYLQDICRKSLAKITIGKALEKQVGANERVLTISGTRSQVNLAHALIEDRIREVEEMRRAIEVAEQHREPRRSPTNSACSSMHSSQNSLIAATNPRDKLLHSKAEGREMEVYVSALASPSKFWVQIIGPQMEKLDNLVRNMTDYYEVAENRLDHEIAEPYVGQIVAALYKYDNKWYRAEIVAILPNEYDANSMVMDLYFVDYGDSEYAAPDEVFELRTDFLTLRFQAVECFLANIKPNNGPKWEQAAIDLFQDRTAVAQWKKLIARVVAYEDRPKPNTNKDAAEVRESSPVPGLDLYDCSDDYELDIGMLLVVEGLAMQVTAQSPAPTGMKESAKLINEALNNANTIAHLTAAPLNAVAEQETVKLLENNNSQLKGNNNKTIASEAKIAPLQLNGDDKSNGNASETDHSPNSSLLPENFKKLGDHARKT